MRHCAAAVLLASVLVCALPGCKSGPEVSGSARNITVIAVYPFGFRWDEPAYRSFELSGRLINEILRDRHNETLVFGPGEFQVFRANDDNAFAASTLGSVLAPIGRSPQELVVLHPWAEKRVESSSKSTVNSKGQTVGVERNEQVTWVGHVEVIHAATRTRIYERTAERSADPFAVHDDDGADPAPELTALMEDLTNDAMKDLAGIFTPVRPFASVPGVSLDVTPQSELAYSEPGRPSYDAELAKLDVLERELFLTARARFANPQVNADFAAKLSKLPGGLHVHEAPPGCPLHQGDVVLSVDGEPAFTQTLVRARLLPGSDLLKVRRTSGDYESVLLPQASN